MDYKYYAMIFIVVGLLPLDAKAACHNDPQFERAKALYDQELFPEAIEQLQGLLARQPDCMNVKFALAMSYFKLRLLDQAESLFHEIRELPKSEASLRQECELHLQAIETMRKHPETDAGSNPAMMPTNLKSPDSDKRFQARAAVGWSDNINSGVRFDQLTFGPAGAEIVLPLSERSKARTGSFHEAEASYQRAFPVGQQQVGEAMVGGYWRDYHDDDNLDVGMLVANVSLPLGSGASTLKPRVLVAADDLLLGGREYRQTAQLGIQVESRVRNQPVIASYRLARSDYRTVENSDGRTHRLNLRLPLGKPNSKASAELELGYQWPESVERLLDYEEASLKCRMGLQTGPHHKITANYAISQQEDAEPYNTLAFGNHKRNLQQQEIGLGWTWKANHHLSYEARLQTRRMRSDIKLFETSGTEITAGLRWETP